MFAVQLRQWLWIVPWLSLVYTTPFSFGIIDSTFLVFFSHNHRERLLLPDTKRLFLLLESNKIRASWNGIQNCMLLYIMERTRKLKQMLGQSWILEAGINPTLNPGMNIWTWTESYIESLIKFLNPGILKLLNEFLNLDESFNPGLNPILNHWTLTKLMKEFFNPSLNREWSLDL